MCYWQPSPHFTLSTVTHYLSSWLRVGLLLVLGVSSLLKCFQTVQGANRAVEDAERERREREDRLRHSRAPAARGLPAASGRARATQEVAAPSPLNPASHTGQRSHTHTHTHTRIASRGRGNGLSEIIQRASSASVLMEQLGLLHHWAAPLSLFQVWRRSGR